MLQKLIYYFTPKTYDSQLHVPRSFLRMCELMSLMKPGVPSKVEQVNGRCLNACKLDCSSSEALADGASVHPSMCSAVSGSLTPILWDISLNLRVSLAPCAAKWPRHRSSFMRNTTRASHSGLIIRYCRYL